MHALRQLLLAHPLCSEHQGDACRDEKSCANSSLSGEISSSFSRQT